ncbi:MAG: N-acetyltransferase [Sphingobacteriales bacterium]|jgi:UDP-2-acetamido-3-amino-2,3-dideoxy-glucuronate N-acetyltransferase|nr:MAG: N-acetyltransferase [Sphingobacteriales bacterium]
MVNPEVYIHPSSVVDADVSIGEGTKIWHFSHISAQASIGKNCIIGQNVFIGQGVIIGNGVKIQNNVSVYAGVNIEDDVFIGPSVVFTNVINPRAFINRKAQFVKTIIKKGASIGANSTIICGNTIGKYAMIGAGSLLSKTVNDYELWYGNPAKKHNWVDRFGNKLNFTPSIKTINVQNYTYTLNPEGNVEEHD